MDTLVQSIDREHLHVSLSFIQGDGGIGAQSFCDRDNLT